MRVAVNDTVAAEGKPPGIEHVGCEQIALLQAVFLELQQGKAFEPRALVGRQLIARPVLDRGQQRELRLLVERVVVPSHAGDLALPEALDDVLARRFVPKTLRSQAVPYTWEANAPAYCDVTRSLL